MTAANTQPRIGNSLALTSSLVRRHHADVAGREPEGRPPASGALAVLLHGRDHALDGLGAVIGE